MKISYKKFSTAIAVFILLIVIIMLYLTSGIKTRGILATTFIKGPKFYPTLIGSLLLIFPVISIISDMRKKDSEVEFKNIKRCVGIFFVTIVWAVLWQTFGHFYSISCIFVGLILFFLNPAPVSPRKFGFTLLQITAIMGPIFLLFAVLLKTPL
jgi:hypothetical protein